MKIIAPISALLGLVLTTLPLTLHAQTTNTVSTPAPAPAAATKTKSTAKLTDYAGVLTAIDPSGTSITVTGTKRSLILAVTPKTKYHKDAPALTSFKVGEHITGSYTTDASGAHTAYSIHLKATTTKAPVAKPATAPAPAAAPVAPVTQ